MGRSNKRTKRNDSSLESSPSNSVSSMLQTPKSSKQLDEISTKLSLILQAVTDLTTAVKESNGNNKNSLKNHPCAYVV